MIDTVILTLPSFDYQVLLHNKFTPSSEILFKQGSYLVKCVNNPTAKDKKEGIYKPRLTLIKRRRKYCDEIPLKIEFSIPKLLFNNNLDELEETDFDEVIKKLHSRLFEMGILVRREVLAKAPVSVFHASKNISLSNGCTSTFAIKELAKINLTKKLDLTKTKFSNEGHSLQYYSNSHSFVLYDKIQDMKKPKGRAVDKDKTAFQTTIFDYIRGKGEYFEVLRLEIRLSRKVKMNSILKKLGYKQNPTIKDIFSKALCRSIIQMYWNELVLNMNSFIFEINSNPLSLLKQIKEAESDISTKKAIYTVGLKLLCKDKGIREFREFIEKKYSYKTWTRIAKDIKCLNQNNKQNTLHDFVSDINEQIDKFQSMKVDIEDFV